MLFWHFAIVQMRRVEGVLPLNATGHKLLELLAGVIRCLGICKCACCVFWLQRAGRSRLRCCEISSLFNLLNEIGLSAKDKELDAVGRQFEPYLTAFCVCTLAAPLWCGLRCCSRTNVVVKAAANTCLLHARRIARVLQMTGATHFLVSM